MNTFDMYLHGRLAGKLVFDDGQRMSFSYTQDYVNKGNLPPISFNMPIPSQDQNLVFQDDALLPFIENLFPEGEVAEKIRQKNKVAEMDFQRLVELMGGDVAGAIVIVAEGEGIEASREEQLLNQKQLSQVLIKTINNPFNINTDEGRRLSLAGAQNKLPIIIRGGEYYLTGSYPSTHILKPQPERHDFRHLVYNEYACMTVAKSVGIDTASVDLIEVFDREGIESNCLAVKRYDRIYEGKHCTRLHQEDFCQIRQMISSKKYHYEEGLGIEDLLDFIMSHTEVPAISKMQCIKMVLFNLIIGNKDAHAKNFSFLHTGRVGKLRLAPAYDLVCTDAYDDLDNRMAMPINGKRLVSEVTMADMNAFCERNTIKIKYLIKEINKLAVEIPKGFDKVIEELEEMSEFKERIDHVRLVKACALDNIRILEEKGVITA